MHLLPLEINPAPSKVNNKTLLIFTETRSAALHMADTLYHYIFLYNCWNINQCFCPAQILTYLVKRNSEGSWLLQRAVTGQTYSQDFQSTEPKYIGGLEYERGMKKQLPSMLLIYLIIIAFKYLND